MDQGPFFEHVNNFAVTNLLEMMCYIFHACARVQRRSTWRQSAAVKKKDSGNGAPGRIRRLQHVSLGGGGSYSGGGCIKLKTKMKAALTETQGLELVLGVGERCTVTNAIQRPGSGHL